MARFGFQSGGGDQDPTIVRVERVGPVGGEAFVCHVGDGQAVEVEVELDGRGGGWLREAGRIRSFHVVESAGQIEVWMSGRRHVLSRVATRGARRTEERSAGAPDRVEAPMPGTVLKRLVEPGHTVRRGQPMVVMESMKMELTLESPSDAVVAEVSCEEGQLVEMGAVLVRLSLEDEP